MDSEDCDLLAELSACIEVEPVPIQSVSLGEHAHKLLATSPETKDGVLEQLIAAAHTHTRTCLDNSDNVIDISDCALYIVIQRSLFVAATEDTGSPQLKYKIPRVRLGKRGRPSRHDWTNPKQEFQFELRLELSSELSFVLYSLSYIPPGVDFLQYNGIFGLIPSSEESVDGNQCVSRYIQRVPTNGMEFQINAPKSRVEHCLVLDSTTYGNHSRFAGAPSDLNLANAQLVSKRRSGTSQIECYLKSMFTIKAGDRITLGTPVTEYTHVASSKKRRSPSVDQPNQF